MASTTSTKVTRAATGSTTDSATAWASNTGVATINLI